MYRQRRILLRRGEGAAMTGVPLGFGLADMLPYPETPKGERITMSCFMARQPLR